MKELSDPEYFYEFMGHAPDNFKIIGDLNIKINMKELINGYSLLLSQNMKII